MTEADSQHQSLCHLMHVHAHACEPTHVQKNAYTHIHHKHTTHKMRKKARPVPKAQFDATIPPENGGWRPFRTLIQRTPKSLSSPSHDIMFQCL